jgi:hypothetical protein
MSLSEISYRDRAVVAIARAIDWCKNGKKMPYTIAFTADEPHCLVRVEGVKTEKDGCTSNVFYRIDGGQLKKMERSRWEDLWYEYRFGPKELEVGNPILEDMDNNDEASEAFVGVDTEYDQ